MKKEQKILICDQCKKEVSDEGEFWLGGHPFHGFLHLTRRNGSSMLADLRAKGEWDFCSNECLKEFLENGGEEDNEE